MNSLFINDRDTIEYGDIVVLYSNEKISLELKVVEGGSYCNYDGTFKHSSIVGKRFGSKLYSENMRGYVYLLRTSSTMHTNCLLHRTEILYTPDISVVLLCSNIKSGSTVVESGTGSGNLSTSIAKTILPTGHLYTFEFNKERARMAQEEFNDFGLEKYITVTWRDVLKDGFHLEIDENGSNLNDKADAAFLDLPSPWQAVDHAHKVLRHNGRICNFSPCIEQVQKVCLRLFELKFSHIRTIECLSKPVTSQNKAYYNLSFSDSEDENEPEDEKNSENGESKPKVSIKILVAN